MDEELRNTMMTDIDPVRDLSDSALDELVPYDHLIARVLSGIEQPAAETVRTHTLIWHWTSLKVGAVAAMVVLIASVAVAFLNSLPIAVPGGFALGAVHSSWIEYRVSTPSSVTYGTATRSMSAALVTNGRISTVLRLNGLTVTAPATSIKPRISAAQMATELWATTSLRGQIEVAFGLGEITLNIKQGRAPELHSVPVWVAIATSKPCTTSSACDASVIASRPLTVVVSGYGLPNRETTTGTPIAFTYQTGGSGSTMRPLLLAAIEQVSVAWAQNGGVSNARLHITAAAVPCGVLNGYSLLTIANVTKLTVKGLIPESTIGDYCTASRATQKIISLRGAVADATKFLHVPVGPIRATN